MVAGADVGFAGGAGSDRAPLCLLSQNERGPVRALPSGVAGLSMLQVNPADSLLPR